MITACRLFGYSSVATFGVTLFMTFILYMVGLPNSAVSIAITGCIFGLIQGIIWGLNQ
ncbi:hypothetical protein [Salmonella phage 7-11]|uniref:Uncharacterized protein n=1 Tax=Salmonella phage 7-11 TaxID=1054968 RepID=G0X548_9CAUD|nr:hypothetical protein SaPh711_gp115 [Salmonella phage 7-11]AEK82030.1 hypothetical protein [Salmonella phage 7-11]